MPNTSGDMILVLAPSTDLASLSLVWPATPYDGQVIRILSTKNIALLTHSGGSLNRSVASLPATGDVTFVYDSGGSTYMCSGVTLSTVVSLSFTGTIAGGAGDCVVYATDSGLVGGTPIFASIRNVQPSFDVADPLKAYAKPVVSGVTVTTNCKISQQNLVTILGISVVGSTTLANAANGTALTLLIHGVLA